MSLAALVRAIPGATANLVAMAVGWLARDETVKLTVEHSGLTVSLNEQDTLRVMVKEDPLTRGS